LTKIGKSINPPLSWYGDFWNGIPPLGKEKSETAVISVWLDRLKTTAEILLLFNTQREKDKSKVLMELHKFTAKDKGVVIEEPPASVSAPAVTIVTPRKEDNRDSAAQKSSSKRKLKNRAVSAAVDQQKIPDKDEEEPVEPEAKRRKRKNKTTLVAVPITSSPSDSDLSGQLSARSDTPPEPSPSPAPEAGEPAITNDKPVPEAEEKTPEPSESGSTSTASTATTEPPSTEPVDSLLKSASAPSVNTSDAPQVRSNPRFQFELSNSLRQEKEEAIPGSVSVPVLSSPSSPKILPAGIASTSTSSRRRVIKSFSVAEQPSILPSPSSDALARTEAASVATPPPSKTETDSNFAKTSNTRSGEGKPGESNSPSRMKSKPLSDGSPEEDVARKTTADLLVGSRPGIVPVAAKRTDMAGRRNSVDDGFFQRSVVSQPQLATGSLTTRMPTPSRSGPAKRVAFGAPKEPAKQLVTRRSMTNLRGQISRMKVQQVQNQVRGTSSTDSDFLSDGTESPTSPRSAAEYIEQKIRKSMETREREIVRKA